MEPVILPFVGFLIGVLIISLGGGGGAFYVGILTGFFDVPPEIAATTSLATIIPTVAVGAVSHYRAGNVNVKLGTVMIAGAVVGAVAGSLFSNSLPINLYNKVTGVLLFVLGVQMLMKYLKKEQPEDLSGNLKKADILKALVYGFAGGGMSGLVGLSGTAPVIAGLTVLRCDALKTVGTSVFVLAGISVTGFLMHVGLGDADWTLAGLLVSGTTAGAFAGPLILGKMDRKKLKKFLPPVLIGMTFFMSVVVLMK